MTLGDGMELCLVSRTLTYLAAKCSQGSSEDLLGESGVGSLG